MKTQTIRFTICLAMVAMLTIPATFALSSGRLKVNVPFSFYAADQLLPAGSYFISSVNGERILQIQRADGPDFATVMTLPGGAMKSTGESSITFHRYGSDNFLRNIQSDNFAINGDLWKSNKEKELSTRMTRSNTESKQLAGSIPITIRMNAE
jgi:hypothetical protein